MRATSTPWMQVGAAVATGVVVAMGFSSDRIGGGRVSAAPPAVPVRRVEIEIDVTGHDYNWHLRYPGADGRLGTGDDVEAIRHLHLPVGAHATLRLHSLDFVYTLAFPDFGLKEIAVPDLEFVIELDAGEVGDYELEGDQFCGFSHPDLMGRLVVQSQADFDAWLASRPRAQ